jgi:IMP dehydrogenase
MIRESYCFDDLLLVPKLSTVSSRSKVDLSVKIRDFTYAHPFIPANMKTIVGKEMAAAVAKSGGLAILHRFMPVEEQIEVASSLIREFGKAHVGVSVGVKENDKEYVDRFVNEGVKVFCIDIAHGHSAHGIGMTKWIRTRHPDILLISGNVATGNGAEALWRAGADVVKCGIGPGSLCLTRINTGNGVPQMSMLMDVAETRQKLQREIGRPIYFISDGGVVAPGDFTKALCFADMVMAGHAFAGCVEVPSQSKMIDGVLHKEYVGSSTHKTNHIEGVQAWVPAKGTFERVLTTLRENLQSGCSYQGAGNLSLLKRDPEFVRITSAGMKESEPHNVLIK